MKIPYIPEHVWQKPIVEDPLALFGKSNRVRLRGALKLVPEHPIEHRIELLTPEILDWFTPLYNKTISQKGNPKLFDIYATTLGKETPYQYFALTLLENGTPIGATIFSERDTILSIAYRIYPSNWTDAKLPANPSLYTEYLINQYAHSRNFSTLSHGRDRNPYGPNSHIGLAIFKLSIGCTPYIAKKHPEAQVFDSDALEEDVLIFEAPETGRQITKGYLFCTEETREHLLQATKYADRVAVETIIRP